MTKRIITAIVAGSLYAANAYGMQEPSASKDDPRIRTASYTTSDMIHITSTDLNPVQIVLQEGEKTDTFAGKLVSTPSDKDEGKAKSREWLLLASGNSIVLQPFKDEPPSYLFVNTVAPDGTARHYRFQIDTRAASSPNGGEYEAVNMTYPAVVAAERRAASAAAAAALAAERAAEDAKQVSALAEMKLRQEQAPVAQGRNWNYWAQNIRASDNSCEIIGPERNAGISDDGLTTRMLFAPHAALPVPYILDQDGRESEVQHSQMDTREGVVMTLHAVAPRIILRRGNRVCAMNNAAYDPIGHQPGTGTVSAHVVRELVK